MSGIFNNGIQAQEYLYDFSVDGGVKDANIDLSEKAGYAPLPDGAIVIDVIAKVITACTSAGSATVSWGPDSDEDGYSGTTIAVASLTAKSLWHAGIQGSEALLWDDTNDHNIYALADAANERDFNVLISTADLTAGKIHFTVLYILPDVSRS